MEKQSEQSGSMLLIDGAYLFLGSRDLEKKTNRKLVVNNVSLLVLLSYMQQKAQVDFLPSLKHYVTAEMDIESTYKRQSLYTSLTKQGITVDIRSFKGKQAFCPSRDCAFSKKSGSQGF
jgi:transcriptional regulatory protein LevR